VVVEQGVGVGDGTRDEGALVDLDQAVEAIVGEFLVLAGRQGQVAAGTVAGAVVGVEIPRDWCPGALGEGDVASGRCGVWVVGLMEGGVFSGTGVPGLLGGAQVG
jgi:hypothetical protein